MATLLRRFFIRDYQNVSDESVRSAHGRVAAAFGLATNFLLVAIKFGLAIYLWSLVNFGAGLLSMALVSDAVNNLSDMATCLVALEGFRMSDKPADKEHPFGHERIEYIAGLIISVTVVALAIQLFRDSLTSVINGVTVDYSILTVVLLGLSVLIKLMQGYVYRSFGKAIDSVTLKDTSIDSLTDSMATFCVMTSGILALTMGWNFLDGYMGIAVSLFVLYSGVRMIIDTSKPLIGETNDRELIEKIKNLTMSHAGIVGVHDIIIHSYGPTKFFVSLHAEVNQNMNMVEAHEIIDKAEEDIKKTFRAQATIHMDPVAVGDAEVDALKNEVAAILASYDPKLAFHDFRVVKGHEHEKIIFDIVLPYDDAHKKDDIRKTLESKFAGRGKTYAFVINFDRPYD